MWWQGTCASKRLMVLRKKDGLYGEYKYVCFPPLRAIHNETYIYNYKKKRCQVSLWTQIHLSVCKLPTVSIDNNLFLRYSYSYRSQCEWPFSIQKHLRRLLNRPTIIIDIWILGCILVVNGISLCSAVTLYDWQPVKAAILYNIGNLGVAPDEI